jgi:glycosyltransferase involved in cell wall biosynthesis
MHLAINASEIGRQRGGNETHLLGLLEGWAEAENRPQVSLITVTTGAARPWGADSPWPTINVGPYRRLPFLLWQQMLALRRLKPDWYLSTYFLPPVLPCRGAVLVHDVSFLAHPEYFSRAIALYMRILVGMAVRQAECVMVDSEFTRQEVRRFYPHVQKPIAVVQCGVGRQFAPIAPAGADREILAQHGVCTPYIFAIGNIHPRKNLGRLLEAYLILRQQGSPLSMVWTGLPRWGSAELLARARDAGVILTGFVPQAHLPAFYRQATVFVYPSLYEGFGLPVLESMACGAPVVCSNTTSLPEVAGAAALLVNPEDSREMAGAIGRLSNDLTLAEGLRRAGLERVKRFTWTNVAQRTLAALEEKTQMSDDPGDRPPSAL